MNETARTRPRSRTRILAFLLVTLFATTSLTGALPGTNADSASAVAQKTYGPYYSAGRVGGVGLYIGCNSGGVISFVNATIAPGFYANYVQTRRWLDVYNPNTKKAQSYGWIHSAWRTDVAYGTNLAGSNFFPNSKVVHSGYWYRVGADLAWYNFYGGRGAGWGRYYSAWCYVP